MQKPRFSIIMPAYNDEEYIAKAIESVLIQTYQSFELIIIDDGSTDSTPEILSEFKKHPRLTVIHQKNGGTAAARNAGLHIVSGEYVCFLDSDDFYTLDRLAIINDYLHENQDVQCATTNHAIWDGKKLSDPVTKDESGEIAEHGLDLLTPTHFCALVLRGDVVETLGFFNSEFYYIEDVEMWYRIHAHGYAVHFINDCSYCYRRYGDINKTTSANNRGIQWDCVKIDIKYVLARMVPLKMRLQCLRWLMGNVRKYVLAR